MAVIANLGHETALEFINDLCVEIRRAFGLTAESAEGRVRRSELIKNYTHALESVIIAANYGVRPK